MSHFDVDDAPPSIRKRAEFYGDLARFGTARRSGEAWATPIRCQRRPRRRACPGLLATHRQDAPPAVHFQCPECGSGGVITGWRDTRWDCSDLEDPPDDAVPLGTSPAAHAELRRVLGHVPAWRQVLYTSSTDGADAVLMVPDSSREKLAAELARAALESQASRRLGHLLDVAGVLAPDSEEGGEEFLSLGEVSGSALAEALSGFEVQRAPAKRPRRKAKPKTYQIKVTLKYTSPPIWRRLLVPAAITLAELHDVLQTAMGWTNSHLHLFEAVAGKYSIPYPDLEPIGEDSRRVRLCDVAPNAKSRLYYEYDFGDGWSHEVLVEKVLHEPCTTVSCVAGRRACPPEDCGGVGGYERLLGILDDPQHEEHDEFVEWLGGPFDPDEFDREEINKLLPDVPPR